MAHDPFHVMDLPVPVRYQAEAMLARALENVDRCGETRSFAGYALESHTMGCRYEAGDADPWAAHWAIFDGYAGDGFSRIMGDPADGAFVTITPERPRPTSFLDGVEPPEEGEFTLGQVRKKVRVPFARGERTAEKVLKDIAPLADFSLIVGSVRRRTLEVADIEIVVLPKNLRKFIGTVEDMGFVEGGDRIRRGAAEGLKAELYIAHRPEEIGGHVLMYTGDFLFNVAMRSKALRMGVHLDQYGIYKETKKGKKYVFQSEEERDFFKKLNMEWHEPEQRSLSWRSQLQKMARELLALDIPKAEKAFLDGALQTIRREKYLPLGEQARLDRIYKKRVPQATGLAGDGPSMGAEELIELGADGDEPGPGPKEWSPRRREIPAGMEERLRKIQWNTDEFRPPDRRGPHSWIWYGMGGPEGDDATELDRQYYGWSVAEYRRVRGEPPPKNILRTSTFVEDDFLAHALWTYLQYQVTGGSVAENPGRWGGFAASLGAAMIGYWGGDEEWVSSLP